jgi:predicted O-methyltransferase YrrM
MKRQDLWRRAGSLNWLVSQVKDTLLHVHDSLSPDPFARSYRMIRPYTTMGNARLRGLYAAVQRVLAAGIPGDIVECGTARGGSAALMGLALKAAAADRILWTFDSFEGLPPPTQADPDYETAMLYTGDFRGELADVAAFFGRLGILDRTRLVKGLFEETVPRCEVGAIAVLHLDGDWYESVKICLHHLYDRVSSGGVIQIDDYGHWEGARKAVDEFMRRRALGGPLQYVDYSGRQLIKP